MNTIHTLRRARNDFALATVMFAATAGGAFWIASSMDEGETFDLHSRLPKTAQMEEFSHFGERVLLIPCAVFPLLSLWNLKRREKRYNEAKTQHETPKPQ